MLCMPDALLHSTHVFTEHTTLLPNDSLVEAQIDIAADPEQRQSAWFAEILIVFR